METPRLICVRVADMEVEPAASSVQMSCTECRAAIWVAHSSQEMLAEGPYKLLCMQCAGELSKESGAEQEPSTLHTIEQLKAQAEAAYDQMYELHDDREIRWQFELADDSLRSAASMAREAGLIGEAEQMEKRRQHIHQVYHHQFMQPPFRLM